uniref:Serpentine receptor class gamma n=1 Tax=Steinernema glaseri TaxID=37863 RepID=A0A1I7YFQ1_9BILA
MSGASLCIYIILVAYLIKQRLTRRQAPVKSRTAWRENWILIYAATKFSWDCVMAALYNYGFLFLPQTLCTEIFLVYSFQLEKMFLSPMLFLIFCTSVRREVFSFLNPNKTDVAVAVVTITTKPDRNFTKKAKDTVTSTETRR